MSISTTDPMIGRLVDGRYRVRSRIARGGMATVYLATDLRLERRVAIKVMHPHLVDDAQFTERFIREARSAARLAHPNVVNVFDQGQDGESAYLVMEYLPGITLRDLLHEYGTLTAEQAMDITEAVLSGLAAAHKAGIVHRDVKPENVLLADDGRIKIGDFGLARAASANTATGAALMGTIAYLSPELVTRGVADTRSDIYAVGIMLYEMLAGEQPFRGEQPMQIAFQHANDSVPTPSSKNPEVPAELDELVLWATARDPEQRPRDARLMLEELYDVQSRLQTPDRPRGAPQPTRVLTPAAMPAATAETQVIGPTARPETGVVVPDSTATLSERTARRRGRGWLIFAAVAVLAALAGGTGWYFGAGPGALVTIPSSVAESTVEQARAELLDLGLRVSSQTEEVHDPRIAPDLVVSTDPPIGEAVTRDTVVTLQVSIGPRPIEMVDFASMTQAEAEAAIEGTWTLDGVIEQFDAEVEKGTVIDALDADGESLLEAETYGELRPITLIVSAGELPAVRGLTFDEASDVLEAAGLTAVRGNERFHNSVDAGDVIGIEEADSKTFIVGESEAVLRISKGPDLVQIPENVIGMTISEAKAALEELDFAVEVNTNILEVFWNHPLAKVQAVEPGAGTSVLRGSTVVINANL